MIDFTTSPSDVGQRIDVLLARHLPDLSRSYIKRLAKEGRMTYDGKVVTSGFKIKRPGLVMVDYDPEDLAKIPDIDLPVLYEDDDIIAINKPAGVITHARGRYWDEASVASFIRSKLRQDAAENDIRAGIVHRLDRGTSGVIVCAKTKRAKESLQDQFSNRTVQKVYKTVCTLNDKIPKTAVIDKPITRNLSKPSLFRVDASGKPAQTTYEILKYGKDSMLVEARPKTGRTHQIRIHLASINAPIMGDDFYSDLPASRLMLHAESISFQHPDGTGTKTITADLPPEFEVPS